MSATATSGTTTATAILPPGDSPLVWSAELVESSAAAPDVVDVVALVVLDEVATGGGAIATGAVEVTTTTVGGWPGAVGVCVMTEVMTSGVADVAGGGGGAWVVGATVDTGVMDTTVDVTAAFEVGTVKVETDVAVENMVDGGRVTAEGVAEDGVVTAAVEEPMLAEIITRSHGISLTSAVRHVDMK